MVEGPALSQVPSGAMNELTRRKVGSSISVAVSTALHALFVVTIGAVTSSSDIDIELTLPEEVEFGLTDAHDVELASAPEPSSSSSAVDPSGAQRGEGFAPDAGVPLPPDDRLQVEADLVAARDAIGAPEVEHALADGRAMSLDDAVAYALEKA